MDDGQKLIVGIIAGFLALTVLTVGIVSCDSHPTPVVVTKNNYPQFMQVQPEDNYVYQTPVSAPVVVQQPYNSGIGDFTTGLVIGNMLSGPSYSRSYDYGYGHSGSRRSYTDNSSVVNNHTTVIHQSAPVTNSKSSSSSVSAPKSSSSGLSQRSVAPKTSSSSGLSSRSVAPKSSAPASKPASKPSTSSRSVAPRSSSSSKSSSSSSSRSSGGSRRKP